MTLWVRALLGILFGAALTLAVHPSSRQFLFGVLNFKSPGSIAGLANLHPIALPPPTTTVDAAYWLQMASEKALTGEPLSNAELATLIDVAKAGRKLDVENAFWPQMLAALLSLSHQIGPAQQEWARASRCESWNDLQTARLLRDRRRLAESGNYDQAWTFGYVYFARSDAPAHFIENFAKKIIAENSLDDDTGMKLRYETVRNGALLRDGSRSIRVGGVGAEIVELATYPSYLSDVKGYKRLWIAQTETVARLRKAGLLNEAAYSDQCFKANEVWQFQIKSQNYEDNVRDLCLFAIGIAALPGSLMLCSGLGLLALLALRPLRSYCATRESFSPRLIAPVAALAAVGCFYASRMILVSACAGGSVAFLCVNPRSIRTMRLDKLGPLFSVTIGTLFLAACASMCLFFISASTPAVALTPWMGSDAEYFAGSRLYVGIFAAMMSLVLLSAPAWALVRRQPTPAVFLLASERFSKLFALGGLALCAISGPLTVYADGHYSKELEDILANEPRYYQRQPF